jgi:hypothetical protein
VLLDAFEARAPRRALVETHFAKLQVFPRSSASLYFLVPCTGKRTVSTASSSLSGSCRTGLG